MKKGNRIRNILVALFLMISILFSACSTTLYISESNSSNTNNSVAPYITDKNINLRFKSEDFDKFSGENLYITPIFQASNPSNTVTIKDEDMEAHEIVQALLHKLFGNYKSPEIGDVQIEDYKIDKVDVIVTSDEGGVFGALYSVRGLKTRTPWDVNEKANRWVIGKSLYGSFIKTGESIELNIIGPNALVYYKEAEQPKDEEIAQYLFEKTYLEPNLLPQKEDRSRLLKYKTDRIEPGYKMANEKNPMFLVTYSVQGIKGKTCWDAGSGQTGNNGWINRKSTRVELIKHGNFYEAIVRGF
jgi:hypothetical protein